jgi:hypothetical protein
MPVSSIHHILADNPAYWRGRALVRRLIADNPNVGEDPIRHLEAAMRYEAEADAKAKHWTPTP